jgi:YegS/Rv2252/BmrU family lipid kinase
LSPAGAPEVPKEGATTTRRILLVVNPASRRGDHASTAALDAFRVAGVECDAVLTRSPGHGGELAGALAARYDLVFTLGGDGTAMEVVGALVGSNIPVGILPGGTGNLMARALGIPLDIRRAIRALLAGRPVPIDLGCLTTDAGVCRHFAFAAGVGADASMVANTSDAFKRHAGVLAYVVSGAGAILRRQSFRVRATVDGEIVERDATGVMVANVGRVLDGLVTLGPGIVPDDGRLDLCVYSGGRMADALRVGLRLVRGDFRPDPCVLFRAGRRFRIETIPARPVQADGELLGSTPFEVTVVPGAARLLKPIAHVSPIV